LGFADSGLQDGGAEGLGVVFKIDPNGNETVLYTFAAVADGFSPYAGVIQDSAGNFYGTTTSGGSASWPGVVYKLDPSGNETVLYSFSGGHDGGYPYAGLVFDAAGNLYGTTANGGLRSTGVIYQIRP